MPTLRLRRRAWPGRLVRWLGLVWQHYRILRRRHGRWLSLREAVRLSRPLLTERWWRKREG